MLRLAAWVVVASWLLAVPSTALEADPYWGAGDPLPDSTQILNSWMTLRIEEALAQSEGRSCSEAAASIHRKLAFFIFQDIEVWALNTELVVRVPGDREQVDRYHREQLYHGYGRWDVGMWMPFVALLEVDGIRISTDKLAHFVSSGWRYRNKFRRELKRGRPAAEAEDRVIRKSILGERTIMGGLSTGVFSPADLEANYQGMRFYLDLCEEPSPLLVREGAGWALREPVQIARYVTPEWDEAYRPPEFASYRWRKVKPVFERYCNLLEEPEFQARMARYRARDEPTATERVLAALESEGSIHRGESHSLETVCPAEDSGAPVSPAEPAIADTRSSEETIAEITAEQQELVVRDLALLGLQLNYPKTAAVSLGFMASREPETLDCPMLCEQRGPFAQLEAGLTGGQLSFGWARIYGARSRRNSLVSKVFLAFGAKVALLRPWGSPPAGVLEKSYWGFEGEFTVARVNFGLGYFMPVHGEHDRLITGGIGWGF